MYKTLFAAITVAATLVAAPVSAQIETDVSAEVDVTVITETNPTINVPRPPLPSRPPKLLPPMRETNKQLIERMRMQKAMPGKPFHASTSGEIRVMNRVNGAVVEDRIIMLPPHASGTPMRPFRPASTTVPRGFFIRAIAASSSNAVFLRGDASTTGFRMIKPFINPMSGVRVVGTTTADGEFIIELPPKPRLEQFMDRVLNLFKLRSETQINIGIE